MTYGSSKDFWSSWAARYDKVMSGSSRLYREIMENMKPALNRNMTVLEIACGTGLLSVKIAPLVKHLEAVDFSPEMIRQAKKKAVYGNLFFSVQDATSLPYTSGTFDAVVISNALHVMPDPASALANIRRVLKDDGVMIAPTFTVAGSLIGRMKVRVMETSGFRVYHKWTPESYLAFLGENGFALRKSSILKSGLTLTYAEAVKIQ